MEEYKIAATELRQFQEKPVEDWLKTHSGFDDHYETLFDLREEDIRWKINNRKYYGMALLSLLFLQNAVVFGLVVYAALTNMLEQLQTVLGIITACTLAETIASVNIIVKWLFNDIDYTKK